MLFHALIASPLGDILLAADAHSLAGLYFTDQRDCPQVSGLAPATKTVSQPSAGTLHGRATRSLKAVPAGEVAAKGSLFETPPAQATGTLSRSPSDGRASTLRLLQSETPASALAVFRQTTQELDEYWRGERKVFDVPLSPQGTAFQQRVWKALLAVPCGATLSYGELGQQAGLGEGHGRAVGTAVGSNPISILIPCHRILAHNRSLNGYGGGLDRKMRLLQLEGLAIR